MLRRLALLFIFLLKINFTLCKEDPLHVHEQLPHVVKPTGYELEVEPYFPYPGLPNTERTDLRFRGSITINFQITQTTPYVWLNLENLEIKKVVLKSDGQNELINQFGYNEDNSQVKVQALDWFEVGENHTLLIDYEGPLYDTNDGGFFYYTYNVNETTQNTVVGTVFEPAMARRMFPCFDDISMKASWHVKVIYPKGGASVFHNTKEESVEEHNLYKYAITFKQTPPVSSYLFSIAVGDFSYSTAQTKRGKDVRSIVFSMFKDYSQKTAEISANCVDAFENLVDYPFPLEKLDNIDSHEFFHGGGIENWGLILYTDVLPQLWESLSAIDQLGVQSIICHENAHQWTGDLVSAKHWGNEFLHESFANYMSYRMIQNFTADNDYLESDFLLERYYGFLTTFGDNHPIATNKSNFDGVTYDTGCSVLRMLEGLIGQDNFYQIVKTYLTNFAFGNADMDDLLKTIDEHFDDPSICLQISFGDLLRDYLTNLYFPILRIGVDSNQRVTFEQIQIDPSQNASWNIPLFIWDSEKNEKYVSVIFEDGAMCGKNNWKPGTIFNYKAYSFAVIQYTTYYWEYLLKLDYTKVDEQTILGLLMDITLDADLKNSPIGKSIPSIFIKKLVSDFNGNLSPHILSFALQMARSDSQLLKIILDAAYPHVNWDANTLREGAFAEHLLLEAVKENTGDALKKATDYFAQFKTDCLTLNDIEKCNKINPNIRTAVYCAGTLNADLTNKQFLNDYIIKLNELYEPRFYLGPELDRALRGAKCSQHTTPRQSYLKKKGKLRDFDMLF